MSVITKVWDIQYILGNTGHMVTDNSGPMTRSKAVQAAKVIEQHGWRGWVAHHVSQKRIFETVGEVAFQKENAAVAEV